MERLALGPTTLALALVAWVGVGTAQIMPVTLTVSPGTVMMPPEGARATALLVVRNPGPGPLEDLELSFVEHLPLTVDHGALPATIASGDEVAVIVTLIPQGAAAPVVGSATARLEHRRVSGQASQRGVALGLITLMAAPPVTGSDVAAVSIESSVASLRRPKGGTVTLAVRSKLDTSGPAKNGLADTCRLQISP